MGLKEVTWEGVNWFHLTQDRDHWQVLVNTIMNLQVPWNAGNFFSRWATFGLLRSQLSGIRYWIGKNVVGSGHGLIWRKAQYIRILSHQAEILTCEDPDMKECEPLNPDTWQTSCSQRCGCDSTRGEKLLSSNKHCCLILTQIGMDW
jgi:hypothetical protein